MDDDNPYEAPEARLEDAPVADAETERRAHLRREAGLRAVGVLCLVFGGFLLLMGVLVGATAPPSEEMAVGMGATFASVGLVALAAAWGYFKLRPWVQVPAGITGLAVLLMSVFLTAPLVFLAAWMTWSAKGRRVLSSDYAAIRAATPALRAWRHPFEVLVVFGVLAIYFVLAVVMYRQFQTSMRS